MYPYHHSLSTHIDAFTLRITSWNHVAHFYEQVLGFKCVGHSTTIDLSLDGINILIRLLEGGTPLKEPTLGLYHMALLLPDRTHLSSILHRIIEKKYPISGLSDHGVSEALYLSDPDGNGFEVYVDRPKANWPMKEGQLDMFTQAANVRELMNLTNQSNSLPEETILGHAHFHVKNLSEARSYYERVLGYTRQIDYGDSATFLSDQGYHHHLGLNTWLVEGHLRLDDQVGLVGYHLHVPSVDDLKRRLNALAINVHQRDGQDYFVDILRQTVWF